MFDAIATYLLDGILAVFLGAVIKFGIPYVKMLLTQKNLEFINTWIEKAVAAAEQKIQGSGLGAEKKAFVVAMLQQLEIAVDDSVDALIEAAVKTLNDAAATLTASTSVTEVKNTDSAAT